MPRTKTSLLNNLSTADLKRLLVARERIDILEKERTQLVKALSTIEKELAQLMAEGTPGAPAKKAGRKKVRRKAAVSAKAGKKTVRKKATTRKVTAKKGPASAGGKVKLEDVVAAVIGKKKGPVAFKDLYAAIVKGKLFKSRSSNFDNVLRRTLSTSKKVKRVGRGLYDVA
jgi:hypothetical protein